MSGQTAWWRSLYSSRRSCLTFSTKQIRFRREESSMCTELPGGSEVVVVDVLLVEDRRRAEDDLPVGADGALAELAGLELLALLAGDLAGGQCAGRVPGEVAEVLRVPQRELLDRAVLDELAHLVRRAEAGQRDLALVLRAGDVARGGGDADRGRRDDALEVRVRLQQALRLLERLLVVVVAVGHLDELHLRVLGLLQLVLHELDPRVLVRGVRGRRQDRNLALGADLVGEQLDLAAADVLGGRLVDEHVPAVGVAVGVVGDDLDVLGHRLLERPAHRVLVVGGDEDRVVPLLDERVDVGDLRGRRGVGRADLLGLRAELLRRRDAGVVDDREVGVVDLLRQERQLQALLHRRVRVRGGVPARPALPGRGRGVLGGSAAGGQAEGQDARRGRRRQAVRQPGRGAGRRASLGARTSGHLDAFRIRVLHRGGRGRGPAGGRARGAAAAGGASGGGGGRRGWLGARGRGQGEAGRGRGGRPGGRGRGGGGRVRARRRAARFSRPRVRRGSHAPRRSAAG